MADNNIDSITKKIIIEFAKTIEMFGLNPLEARLFAALYLSEQPMTLDDMSDTLGKSKTSMSTSIRGLLELNLVSRVWKKGVRKDLYQANTQLFKLFISSYINKWIDATAHQKDALEEISQLIQKQQQQKSSDQLNKLDLQLIKIIEFHKQMESFFRGMH